MRLAFILNSRPTERPRLCVERSVLGYQLPSVSRRTSSASRLRTTSQWTVVCRRLAAAGPGS
eukprot:scaffold117422_cov70-Phaeocystis_antarctica.AAC.1